MPKKIHVVLFALFLWGAFVGSVVARTPIEPNTEAREEKKERMDAVKTEVREVRMENKEERQEKREDRRSALAELHGRRLESRFGFYGKRFESLIERLQSRLNTLKDSGKNTEVPQKTLDSAKAELQKAQAAANNATLLFQSIPKGETAEQRAALEKAKEAAELARKSFMSVQKMLMQVIREIKAL